MQHVCRNPARLVPELRRIVSERGVHREPGGVDDGLGLVRVHRGTE